MTQFLGNYIDQTWSIPQHPTDRFIRYAPGNRTEITFDFSWDLESVDTAVASAKRAFKTWKRTDIPTRIEHLKRLQSAFQEEASALAFAIAIESGKPLWEARTEVNALIGKIDIMTTVGLQETATVKPFALPNGQYVYRPLGVLAVISPFNFPVHLANGHIVPALLSGNCVIVKPAIITARSMQIYFKCVEKAGFPPGVINLVHGDADVGSRLVAHRDVAGVLFTGSYKIGTAIRRATIEQPSKMVALELGGKNTSIVLPDADLDQAASEIFQAAFLTTGQRCSATSRIVVHHEIEDELIDRLKNLITRITIGDPIQNDPFMGPLATKAAFDAFLKIEENDEGGKLSPIIQGGLFHSDSLNGYYVRPGLWRVKEVDPKGPHQAEEIFGPDIVVYNFTDDEQAADIANATDYGLAMSVFTRDVDRFESIAYDLETGILNLNRSTVGASGRLPFGGVKNSGNHRPSAVLAARYCAYPQAQIRDYVSTPNLEPDEGPLSKLLPAQRPTSES